MKYNLELTPDQAKFLCRVCDFYSRMMIGQWDELFWYLNYNKEISCSDIIDNKEEFEEYLLKARDLVFPGLNHSFGHSYGVGKFTNADHAYEMLEVIRNKIAWTEHPEGGYSVDFDTPMSFSGDPLIKCDVIQE